MKITLKDFLCYENSTFDFGGEGMTLLSGPSGVGKTSILRGIFFALFGEGNKLQTYGKLSSRVELEFDDIKIVRTKRPNRLIVNDVYEDDSAQEIINKKFGDTFKTSGYIQQNNLSSFILMSPIEKLAFLEKFAFRDVDLGKIKSRCKAHITKCNEELLIAVSKLDMAKNILNEFEIPTEVNFPLKCKKDKREQAIKNENIRFKNCNTLIIRSEKKIKKYSEEINDLRVLEATLQSRNEIFEELIEKIKNISFDIERTKENYIGDRKLEKYQRKLENLLLSRELNTLEKQQKDNIEKLEEMRTEEENVLLKEKSNIESSLWKEYSKSETISTITELKQCLSDLEKVESLRNEIKQNSINLQEHQNHKDELEKQLEKLQEKQNLYEKLTYQQELYSCPSCCTKLRLKNKQLVIANVEDTSIDSDLDTLSDEIKILKHSISKLQHLIPKEEIKIEHKKLLEDKINNILSSYEDIPDMDDINDDLEYILNYKTSQIELNKKLKDLEYNIREEKYSKSYTKFKQSIEKTEEKIDKYQNDCKLKGDEDNDEYMDEEELREEIIKQKQIRDKIDSLELNINKKEGERDKCKLSLDRVKKIHIEKYGDINNEYDFNQKLKIEENNILNYEDKRKEHANNLKVIDEWNKYQEELKNYQSWELKVENLEINEKESRNEYAAATQLKDKILEAESIAMLNIINSINTHARLYLDLFFVDNPISAQVRPFKQTKKNTKPSINIEVEYKGMEADINMLSGGELSRLILAYTLALAEMFNTPLLLLDECTASLDQELSGVVFDSIRENFNGKITLVIAHQVVTGTFDKTICL